MNTELFKKIHEVISPTPGSYDPVKLHMSSWEDWESGNGCGTTRCVGGWAISLTTGHPLYLDGARQHPSVIALAAEVGAATYSDGRVNIESLAAKLLGLNGSDRGLFYVGEDEAAEFVLLAAQGRDGEALEVLDR